MEIYSFRISDSIIQGRYNKDDYRTGVIGTSDCNQYIPFYSLFFHEFISFKDTDVKIIEYSLPISARGSGIRRYDQLLSALVTNQTACSFNFTLQGTAYKLNIHRGLIYTEEGIVLMCLGIDSNYLLNTPMETVKTSLDKSKLVLFISNELNSNIYKNLRKKLDVEFFSSCREQNIDMVLTNDINKWVFKNNFKTPKFKSIKEMNGYLKDTLPKNLLLK